MLEGEYEGGQDRPPSQESQKNRKVHASGSSRLSLLAVLLLKTLDPTGRINELLFAGEEWVAGRADFDVYVLFGRSCSPALTASTGYPRLFVLRMDVGFHSYLSVSWPNSGHQPKIQLI
jgi:hypothetical protein